MIAVALMAGFPASKAAAEMPAGAVPMELISSPAVSHDGKSMVFEWCGDVWTASTDGGEANRVVNDPSQDDHPRFTPDGKRIVFTSDRSGSLQVYSVPAVGGEVRRHTSHTEGNMLECVSPDGTHAVISGKREGSEPRLMEIDLTADHRERRLFDAAAHSAAWSPDGSRILFCRGGEQVFRKGYHGPRASRIWIYQKSGRVFTPAVEDGFEARSPLWLPDGTGFHYVSNRTGTANLWLRKSGSGDGQLTFYSDDGVITPDRSADGSTFVFLRGTGVFRFRPETEQTPVEIRIWTKAALRDTATFTTRVNGTASADFTADMKQAVFAAAGDLWITDGSGREPERLASTESAEDEVRFSPDGRWLYFLRDDGISANYFRARLEGGILRDEQQVTRGTRSKRRLMPSPDGSNIAWVEGTGDLIVADADGRNSRRVFHCWEEPDFDWSPDGRWLALAAEDRDSNTDIWLAAADGGRPPENLTWHPAPESSPKWSPDGKWIAFTARRGTAGAAGLWRIAMGGNGTVAGDPAAVPIKGIEPIRVAWSADSMSLWFQSADSADKNLYSIQSDGSGMRTVTAARGMPIRAMGHGGLLWRTDRTPAILTSSGMERFPIGMNVERNRAETSKLAFRRIWRTLGERFHDEKLNGRDWEALRLKYEIAASAARDSRQFDRVVSQGFGELNSSHLGFLTKPWDGEDIDPPSEEKTAHPGMIFRDEDADGAPLTIQHVISGSPAAMLGEPPRAGEVIVRIAGQAVDNRSPLHGFFAGAEDRPLPVTLRGADGRERVIELRCISYQKARSLARKEHDAELQAKVAARDVKTRLVRVRDMSGESLEDLKVTIHRASQTHERLILDLRGNSGGREADRMLNLFCQPTHSFTVPRDGPAGYPLERRTAPAWDKALVVLCDENTFSNSEIFCHAVKQLHRAPLVGATTAGCVISTVAVEIPDAGELQVPFRAWFHAGSEENMEPNGARPDHPVAPTPADEDAGRDPQLEKALEIIDR